MSAESDEAERVGRWWGRLDASKKVYEEQRVFWDRIEDALAGTFPSLIPTQATASDVDSKLRLRHNDQIDLNLMLRSKRIFEATAYDEFPSLRFSREPKMEEELVVSAETMIEKIMDQGGAVYESRSAMGSSMSRGSWNVRIYVEKPVVSPKAIAVKRIPASAWTDEALKGNPAPIPKEAGIEQVQAIAAAAKEILQTPELALGLAPAQIAALQQLAIQADTAHSMLLEGPHPVDRRASIKYEALPYGSWLLFDTSVTDRKRMGWIAFKQVFTPGEFESCDLFSPEAKKEVMERYAEALKTSDGHVPGQSSPRSTRPPIDEQDRIVVWCIEDKVNWKRHYLSEILKDKFLETNDEFPYLNENGEPLFPEFFSVVVRTPLEHNKEVAWRLLGIPVLEPGWPMQVEFIKTRSAWMVACKKSGRYGFVANGADDKALDLLARGVDGTWVKPGANYEPVRDGPLFNPISWGQAPADYLAASRQSMADFCNAVGISLAAMTGEPVADTLGQEQIALTGATLTQMDMVRCYESGFAELAGNTYRLFLANASPAEMAAYMGPEAVQPRTDSMGRPKPSLYDALRNTPLDGCKLGARFASGTRAEDLASIKSVDDFIALVMTARDGTGMPMFDVRPLLERAAKLRDIQGLVPYQPSAAEMMLMLANAQANQQPQGGEGGDREAPGGGREDGRKAGGKRGAPAVPGRQARHRAPQTAQQMAGVANRAYGATS